MMIAHRTSLLVLVVATCGCDGSGVDPPAYAEAPYEYACVGFADVACDQTFPELAPIDGDASTEPPIALGASFGIKDGVSLSPSRIATSRTNVFQADQAGIAAILAGHTVVHFDVRPPADIRVTHESDALSNEFTEIAGVDSFSLRIPDRFRAAPIDAEGHMLAGDLGCTWTTTDASVVSVDSDPANNVVTFTIHGPGQATLHVAMGSLSKDIPFDIQ